VTEQVCCLFKEILPEDRVFHQNLHFLLETQVLGARLHELFEVNVVVALALATFKGLLQLLHTRFPLHYLVGELGLHRQLEVFRGVHRHIKPLRLEHQVSELSY